MTQAANPIYFKGFNGVRFIAASAVIIHHIEEYKSVFLFGREDLWARPFAYQLGRLGVSLFFVLSGFLITYLLLAEKQKTGRIAIRKFYIRRVLRIWPLYFLVVGLGLVVWPLVPILQTPALLGDVYDQFGLKLLVYGLVLPNFALALFGNVPMVSHTWSIGVEEQFYLMWPWLVMSNNPKRTLKVVASVVGLLALWFLYERFVARPAYLGDDPDRSPFVILAFFMAQFRIGCMAIGGVGAWLLFSRNRVLSKLFQREVQLAVYGILLLCIAFSVRVPGFNYEFYALFFCFMLLNLAGNPASLVKLDNPVTRFMGDISYGLYMYHPLLITLCMNSLLLLWPGLPVHGSNADPVFMMLLYVSSFVLTTLVAWLSYQYFEKPFLSLKDRFAVVASSRRPTEQPAPPASTPMAP
ncbi:acyltransferase family protein [uncultured Fibrella sp.]|uniref:acyltransferase family protein n=1 Tax=uncultured Fibrella sp. TaxID=1284596 RepID=UPI0035CA595B